ncbi:MAG: anion permease [Dehalococcoidales bacterium]|jgi:PiT family inorganic phosphate transporter|nr:anion permease [Dehalococcoidales bacterium]MDP7285541.1 anion permease [Dehalococcoidales bacterium]MDP7415795.1 anion permease [Dehalococcoidales bacterium]
MPDSSFGLLILVIVLAIGFGVVNGFNDAANAIAAAIGTRALSPRTAIIVAVIANFAGAATGTAVAHTIGKGILIQEVISYPTLIAALASIIVWGTLATKAGLPISIHHGFIAGLAAAGMAAAGSAAVVWSVMQRVLAAVVIAPTLGFIGGFIIMLGIYWSFRNIAPDRIRRLFSRGQFLSTAFMAYSHGKNDGQMPIGVITMALVIYYNDVGIWDRLSLLNPDLWWVIVISAAAISSGMAMGGWRVIKTVGMRMTSLRPVHGFATHIAAASVIEAASHFGVPVSTTHCVSTSVMGVGATHRFSAVRWSLASNIVTAWILTFPICGALGYLFTLLLKLVF